MSDRPITPDETAHHGEPEDGFRLVLEAEDCGDWEPVARWLARNPARAGEVGQFLEDQELLRGALPPAAPAPARPGTGFGALELHEQVGEGGMGVVYRAFDRKLNREVAVKMLRGGGALSAADLARFRLEAETVAALDHPNIVPVHYYGEHDGAPFLVMPLMTGGTLEAYRKKQTGGRLPEKEAARLVRDVARGVHHAHQRGLIHRDLKPLNVLLDDKGTPQVADFGLARPIDQTASVGIAGTYGYMAPEQVTNDKALTTAVDVHALGVMLFELLTGRLPFGGGAQALKRVVADPAPPVHEFVPGVSRDLEAVCLKCLEKDPAARYTTALEVVEELDRFLRREPVQARPPGFWDWLRQLARTRPEPHPRYSWEVTVWFGAVSLLANALIYWMVRTDAPAAGIWAVNAAGALGFGAVLWWYMLRRFRQLPVTERHSLIIATGHIIVYLPLMAAFVPLSLSAPAREGLGIYPPLAVFSGFGFFILGSTNWSRFFPIGILTMGLVPVMTRWPESSPLVFGFATAAVVWYWSYAKKDGFGYKPDAAPAQP